MVLNENLECIYKQKVSGIYLAQEYWQNEKKMSFCVLLKENGWPYIY